MSRRPHAIDRDVGARLCLRRRSLGMSQAELGAAIGVTFQQVQKYEKGINRMAVSTLYEVAKALGVPITYFLEGMEAEPFHKEPDDAPREVSSLKPLAVDILFARISRFVEK
ncbi:helix-turn-helix domain-containing protein [Nitrospirillum pindoramense]|uniref:Transcriptional regulator with XRE-family HTH domain n=1 Tax=Nitrospirillum amazonense TaxID=28077 RepID=A0A560GLB9_9PROT|nr:helix-turn-helix transcriptional regulator [Nitrospirillum amazonense]TWB34340.1 transcriptional regulator with XRE-family HTH domain [Nitrospirillum amazonense]